MKYHIFIRPPKRTACTRWQHCAACLFMACYRDGCGETLGETLSLEILPKIKRHTTVSPVASTMKKVETQTLKRAREEDFDFIEEESMSLLSFKPFKKPMQDLQQTPTSINQKSKIYFRKKEEYLALPGPSSIKKTPNRVFNEDHDYLANLPGQSSTSKTPSSRSKNNEDETKKHYEDTVNVLYNINSNVSRVADNLENLVSEFKTHLGTLKELLETLKPNLN